MLKKKIVKKISLVISVILVIFIINLFPTKNNKYNITTSSRIIDSYIFLLDSNNYVSKVPIIYKSNNLNDLIYEISSTLTKDSEESKLIRSSFNAIIPKNTKLLNYKIKDKVLYLNYNSNILNIPSNLERKMIECIIYSYINLDGINSITILVNNKNYKDYSNLDKSYKINIETILNSTKDINEVVIYYPAKDNDFNYYIPVTKTINSKDNKIDIIIKELKSSTTYNTNMVNYLDDSIYLSSSNILDDTFILNFKGLSTLNSINISEEVKYALNESIKDNYNVKQVSYNFK